MSSDEWILASRGKAKPKKPQATWSSGPKTTTTTNNINNITNTTTTVTSTSVTASITVSHSVSMTVCTTPQTVSQPPPAHKLHDVWILWFHDMKNDDWTLKSYEPLLHLDTVEDIWIIHNQLSDVSNGMYYLMRKGYPPIWDDVKNVNGGAWTFKVEKNQLNKFWEEMSCYCLGETICAQSSSIVGLSISPKVRFATVRVWTDNVNPRADIFKHIAVETQKNAVVIDFKQARFTANKDAST